MLDQAQLDDLHGRGWTTVAGVVAPGEVESMLDLVWDFLESRGLVRDDPTTWPETVGKLQPLRKAGVFDPFLGPALDAIADQLMGAGRWTSLNTRPQALITMPFIGPWQLPHKVWHLDLPGRAPTEGLAAVRYFGLLDDVDPRGGGTLVVEGSHELVRRMVAANPERDAGSSSDLRKQLRQHEFFARLAQPNPDTAEFMDTGAVIDGVKVRVGELTGRAGDLVVMHPWLMHNIAMNASNRPRIAMSHSAYTTDVSFYGGG